MALDKYKFEPGDVLPAENVNSIDPDNHPVNPVDDAYKLVRLDDGGQINNELLNIFTGDGSDGDVVISSSTSLTRDMFYNDLTINSGVTLTTAGYKIFIKGNLDNNGTIDNSGVNGQPFTAGTGAPAGTFLGSGNGGNGGRFSSSGQPLGGGGGGGGGIIFIAVNHIKNEGIIIAKGGNGGNGQANAGSGSTFSAQVGSSLANGIVQSSGGKGGNQGGSTGAAGGVITNIRKIADRSILQAQTMFDFVNLVALTTGAGGGGGVAGSAGHAGSGGGGGGGIIIIFYSSIQTTGTLSVSGGVTGTPVGNGLPGVDGADGKIIKVKL